MEKIINKGSIYSDVILRILRSQVLQLTKIIEYLEEGNHINDYVNENTKSIEKNLRWLRKFYFDG